MAGRLGRWGHVIGVAALVAGAPLLAACSDADGDRGGAPTVPSTAPIGTPPPTPTTAPEASVPPASVTAGAPGSPTDTTTSVAALPPNLAPGAVVVIDPGHNGANGAHPSDINRLVDAGGFQKACNTTGTAEGALTESSFNLDLARLVRSRLEQAGVQVLLTRDDDSGWGPCIDERGQVAAQAGADALVSLHADGADPGAHGFHVIHPTAIAGYTDTTAAASATLAADLRDALVDGDHAPATYAGSDGLVARGDLGTINRAETPAAMVEVGNMHNPGDLDMMTSLDERSQLADALAAGVLRFLAGEEPG